MLSGVWGRGGGVVRGKSPVIHLELVMYSTAHVNSLDLFCDF